MSAAESENAVKISKGDIIRLEYDAWIVETGALFDTTSAERAKEGKIFNEDVTYTAIPMLVGGGRTFSGLEEALEGAEVGVEKEVVIPPEKAAGQRDPKLIELHPVREFVKQEIEPRVGMEVSMKNRMGTIIAVTTGRVRVDFNRPLAGKSLKYRFKVLSKIEAPEDKIKAILEMDYGTSDGFKPTIEDRKIVLILPDVCKYDQKWLLAKYRVVTDLRDAMRAETVQFVEEF
ncbi:MAG: peptidylprolyl isomerase, partial [Methanomassiliicoccales archaeon]|nr:peptidylprolyl isomerase [Methanomassiliicoccales archaeon]